MYSPVCSQAIPFEFFVGKTAELGQADLNWLGAQQGELGMVFPEEWSSVSVKVFDSSGRLNYEESIGDVFGEAFVALPKKPWGGPPLKFVSPMGKGLAGRAFSEVNFQFKM